MSIISEFGTKKYENDEVTIVDADTETTFHISTDGTDSQTNRYMNLPNGCIRWSFVPSAAVTITEVNGIVLKVPKTVGDSKEWSGEGGFEMISFKVKCSLASTNLKLSVKG